MLCPHCGKENPASARFCAFCGKAPVVPPVRTAQVAPRARGARFPLPMAVAALVLVIAGSTLAFVSVRRARSHALTSTGGPAVAGDAGLVATGPGQGLGAPSVPPPPPGSGSGQAVTAGQAAGNTPGEQVNSGTPPGQTAPGASVAAGTPGAGAAANAPAGSVTAGTPGANVPGSAVTAGQPGSAGTGPAVTASQPGSTGTGPAVPAGRPGNITAGPPVTAGPPGNAPTGPPGTAGRPGAPQTGPALPQMPRTAPPAGPALPTMPTQAPPPGPALPRQPVAPTPQPQPSRRPYALPTPPPQPVDPYGNLVAEYLRRLAIIEAYDNELDAQIASLGGSMLQSAFGLQGLMEDQSGFSRDYRNIMGGFSRIAGAKARIGNQFLASCGPIAQRCPPVQQLHMSVTRYFQGWTQASPLLAAGMSRFDLGLITRAEQGLNYAKRNGDDANRWVGRLKAHYNIP